MRITHGFFEEAKQVAAAWQTEIESNKQDTEIKFHAAMQRMLDDPTSKAFLIELLDQSFRSYDAKRVADQLEYIFAKYQHTAVFSHFEELLVWSFRHLGIYLPELSIPIFIKYLRYDISHLIIQGEDRELNRYLNHRRLEGTRVNINLIGESVLGEQEAEERVATYIKALENPNIDYISIKISTLFSQIAPIAHDWTVNEISNQLARIYQAALDNPFTNAQGLSEPKFVNLDMEAYSDIDITMDVFMQTLSQKPFHFLKAGIVLQAYLPDTLRNLQKLVAWAKERVDIGGSPIKVRLVKGANQEMELTESSSKGWPNVTYLNKAETDANYKILMDYALDADVTPYVHIGIASHNLFDQALGFLISRQRNVTQFYTAEMLQGMSEAGYHMLKNKGLSVILYAPIATAETFTNAIAYLVRRFDESTAQQNFLRHSFGLSVQSPAWQILLESYDKAIQAIPNLKQTPYRTQNRSTEKKSPIKNAYDYVFANEPETDFSLPQNIKWAEAIRDQWQSIGQQGGFHATPVIGGQAITSDQTISVIDKSQYHPKATNPVTVGHYSTASKNDLQTAVTVAQQDPDGWRKLSIDERQQTLMRVAQEFKAARADLIGIAAAELGKVFSESDVEISEAIDFLNFYPYSVQKLSEIEGLQMQGHGVGLVVSPWNFPIAIPVGGVAAALAAGNTVILKPASNTVLCAYRLCQCFWDAGVSKNTLQFVPCSGELAGQALIPNPAIDFVIFTGSETTAQQMLKIRPDLHISAETGGKDATIVTAMADRDQAVKNILGSAFNHSGQKCSATSLLILEREVYEDEHFKQMLIDGASSLTIGSVWALQNRMTCLVDQPSGKLQHALTHLEENEQWLLAPSYANNNPYMLKPAIRYGTQEGQFCHQNELFGPVLSVMCADNLQHAIEIVNATGYGLTSGLESLDEREQQQFIEKIRAGNLYINRMTTGAIVQRQPFGGMGKSAIGSGKKAGCFNYVSQFMQLSFDETLSLQNSAESAVSTNRDSSQPFEYGKRLKALLSQTSPHTELIQKAMQISDGFVDWLNREFKQPHDYSQVRGEHNILKYIAVKSVLFRFTDSDPLDEILSSMAAAKMVGAKVYVSLPKQPNSAALKFMIEQQHSLLDTEDSLELQDESELIKALPTVERIRFLNPESVSSFIYESIAEQTLYIASQPFIPHGRIELMHYFIEQSISNSYHRYGNLGLKGLEET